MTFENELVAKRTKGLLAVRDTVLVSLSRPDYLRICGSLESEVVTILQKSSDVRSESELMTIHGLFQEAQFFRMLFYSHLQLSCCRMMKVAHKKCGETIARAGEHSGTFCIMMLGRAQPAKAEGEPLRKPLVPGDSLGFDCVLGLTAEEQHIKTTVTAIEDCTFATLTRSDFVHISEEIGETTVTTLEKAPNMRSAADIEEVHALFSQLPFMKNLRSRLLQRYCCRYLRVIRANPGQVIYKQGEVGVSRCLDQPFSSVWCERTVLTHECAGRDVHSHHRISVDRKMERCQKSACTGRPTWRAEPLQDWLDFWRELSDGSHRLRPPTYIGCASA
jgi:hypothetical protein